MANVIILPHFIARLAGCNTLPDTPRYRELVDQMIAAHEARAEERTEADRYRRNYRNNPAPRCRDYSKVRSRNHRREEHFFAVQMRFGHKPNRVELMGIFFEEVYHCEHCGTEECMALTCKQTEERIQKEINECWKQREQIDMLADWENFDQANDAWDMFYDWYWYLEDGFYDGPYLDDESNWEADYDNFLHDGWGDLVQNYALSVPTPQAPKAWMQYRKQKRLDYVPRHRRNDTDWLQETIRHKYGHRNPTSAELMQDFLEEAYACDRCGWDTCDNLECLRREQTEERFQQLMRARRLRFEQDYEEDLYYQYELAPA